MSQLYLAVNDVDHTCTKARSPQTNGICERFHKTILNEFYQVTFRKKIYTTLEELQADLDEWIDFSCSTSALDNSGMVMMQLHPQRTNDLSRARVSRARCSSSPASHSFSARAGFI